MNYWLFKKEPKNISIDDFEREGTLGWHGVRNYQARNSMRDDMALGDQVLIYHSNSEPSAVMGVGEIVSAAYADHTAQDPAALHFDPKSTPENPIWTMIDVRLIRRLDRPVSLQEIRDNPKLKDMLLIRRGMRLSLQPVSQADFEEIVGLGTIA
jgi:predicted RNA-binding protein with PUA-like domain